MNEKAPEKISLRWTEGAAVTSGPLMNSDTHTRYIREDVAQAMTQKARDEALEVRPLVWAYHPAGESASTGMGSAYIIDLRDKARPRWLKWPNGYLYGPECETLGEMKAAAQADYEARILAALKGGEA